MRACLLQCRKQCRCSVTTLMLMVQVTSRRLCWIRSSCRCYRYHCYRLSLCLSQLPTIVMDDRPLEIVGQHRDICCQLSLIMHIGILVLVTVAVHQQVPCWYYPLLCHKHAMHTSIWQDVCQRTFMVIWMLMTLLWWVSGCSKFMVHCRPVINHRFFLLCLFHQCLWSMMMQRHWTNVCSCYLPFVSPTRHRSVSDHCRKCYDVVQLQLVHKYWRR